MPPYAQEAVGLHGAGRAGRPGQVRRARHRIRCKHGVDAADLPVQAGEADGAVRLSPGQGRLRLAQAAPPTLAVQVEALRAAFPSPSLVSWSDLTSSAGHGMPSGSRPSACAVCPSSSRHAPTTLKLPPRLTGPNAGLRSS